MSAHPTVDRERVADALIGMAMRYRARHPEVVALRESEAHQRGCPTCSAGDLCPDGRQFDTRARTLAAEAAR
jgi:hypothetical protein